MKIELLYGREAIVVELPDDLDVRLIQKPAMPRIEEPEQAVLGALDHPVGCQPLERLAQQSTSACIAICDITRPVPNHLFLRPLIERLVASGIPLERISIVVATGLHRPNVGEELVELIGDPWVLDHVQIFNHDARNDDEHVDLGRTVTMQTPVRLDRRFVEADLRIATGLVEPHFMAGYSGGRKVISPGLAHAETITTFHSGRFMADPAAINCNFAHNPLHEEQLEIVKLLGGALALNTVIDEQRQLSFVNFGEIVESHYAAVDFVRDFCEVSVDRPFSTVVTSAAGYPLDKTYYQTIKGMVGGMDILASGGDLIIASECSEGMGSDEFVDAQRRLVDTSPEAFLESILQKSHADIDEWQTQMQLKPQSIGQVHLYSSGLSSSMHSLTGVNEIDSIRNAILESVARSGDRSIVVIPEGPYVIPRLSAQASTSAG